MPYYNDIFNINKYISIEHTKNINKQLIFFLYRSNSHVSITRACPLRCFFFFCARAAIVFDRCPSKLDMKHTRVVGP